MDHQYFILDKITRKITATTDSSEWAKGMQNNAKRVAEDTIGTYWISTVFMGLDHNFSDSGRPLLFETMVFPKREDGTIDFSELYCDRYSTMDAAETGHAKVIAAIQTIVNHGHEVTADDLEQLLQG